MIAVLLAASLFAQSIAAPAREIPVVREDNSVKYAAAILLTTAGDVGATYHKCADFATCEANPLFENPHDAAIVNTASALAVSAGVVVLEKKGHRSLARGITFGWVAMKALVIAWNAAQ